MNTELDDLSLAKEIYAIVQRFIKEGVLHAPKYVMIVRPGMKCVQAVIQQLKWATQHGLWFKWTNDASLQLPIPVGSIRGNLILQMNRMTFTAEINPLNFHDFDARIRRLRDSLSASGYQVEFPPSNPYSLTIQVSVKRPLAENNAWVFFLWIRDALEKGY